MHGEVWLDEYAWLADGGGDGAVVDPEVRRHLQLENAYAEGVLAATQRLQRDMLDEMLQQERYESVSCSTTLHGHTYYTRFSSDFESVECRRRCMGDGTHGEEEVVLDRRWLRDALGATSPPTLGPLKMSPDGRMAALTVDTTGCERHDLVVLGFDGHDFRRVVDRVADVGNMEWSSDSRHLAYTSPDHMRRPSKLHVRRVGNAGSDGDREIFEERDQRYFLDVGKTKDERRLTVNLNSKTSSEVWVMSTDALGTGREVEAMQLLCPRGDATYFVEHRGDRFYVVTNADGAYKCKVMSVPEDALAREHWEEFIPESPTSTLVDAETFQDYCVTYHRDSQGLLEIRCTPFANPSDAVVARLPEKERVSVLEPHPNVNFAARSLMFSTTCPIVPHVDWVFHMDEDRLEQVRRQEPASRALLDPRDFTCHRITVPARDGVTGGIPVTLVHRSDLRLDGGSPLLLLVYGSYGEPLEPTYSTPRLSLLRRGWVLAYCHVRGGGELGHGWHQQAVRASKATTFSDLSDCAHRLVSEGYTSADRMCVRGVSAGGLAAAVLCNEHPELLAAAVIKVPFVDVLTAMADASLPLTAHEYDEWGDPATDVDAFRAISAYCPYRGVRRQAYPEMLITGSLHDERVQYWHPAKLAARLRDHNEGDSQILLRTDMDGGHFSSNSYADEARDFAFLQHAVEARCETWVESEDDRRRSGVFF